MKARVCQAPERCYDVPGQEGDARVPCRVSHIVETHCARCHGSAGGLDVKRWRTDAHGAECFAHTDPRNPGKEFDCAESLERVRDRILHPDPALRMPLAGSMKDTERQELYSWLEKALSEVRR